MATRSDQSAARAAVDFVRELTVRTVKGFYEARAPTMASSMSYYLLATLAPLAVLTLWVATLAFGPAPAHGLLWSVLGRILGRELGSEMVRLVGAQANKNFGQMTGIIAVLFLLFGAGSLFLALQHALNVTWRVKMSPKTDLSRHVALRAALAFATVFLPAVLLVAVTSARNIYMSTLYRGHVAQPPQVVNTVAAQLFALIGSWMLVSLLFLILPDGYVGWGSLALGAGFTAISWWLVTWGLGLYMSHVALTSHYGAAGSLVALLIWVFLIMQLLLAGARLTFEHARLVGQPVRPRPWAESYKEVGTTKLR